MKYITRKQKIIIGFVALFVAVVYTSVSLFPTNNPLYGFVSVATLALVALPFMVVGSIISGKNRTVLEATPKAEQAEAQSQQKNASLRRTHSTFFAITAIIAFVLTSSMTQYMHRDQQTVVVGAGDMILIVPPVLLFLAVLVVYQIVLSCTRKPRHLLLTSLSAASLLIAIITFVILIKNY